MKPLFWRIGAVAASAALACCLFGCSSQPAGQQEQQGDTVAEEEQQANPLSFVGAFHPLTGMSEPTEFNGTPEQIEEGRANLIAQEGEDDEKVLFVMVRASADERENLNFGIVNGNMRGGIVSAAELTIDDVNTYSDNYGLNSKGYFETLEQLGYHDGAESGELLGGSGETYGAVFVFFISNNDYNVGETAHLEWGDYSVDFNMSDIQEVDSPVAMIDALETA
ncbi:hypothetical protein [Slackia sp.]|uniref:hypothetical protein n=1 Tax=Slackia sp. TaxID=2049041 RepID=UPI003999DDD0